MRACSRLERSVAQRYTATAELHGVSATLRASCGSSSSTTACTRTRSVAASAGIATLAERLAADGHSVTYLTLRQWDRGARGRGRRGLRAASPGRGWRSTSTVAGGSCRRSVFGGRRAVASAAPRSSLRRRPHGVVSVLLAARGRGRAAAARGYDLVVDWFELWSRAYWRDYLGGVGGRVGWTRAEAVPARSAARVHAGADDRLAPARRRACTATSRC